MSDPSPTKLYVGNLAWEITDDSLKERFSEFGEVVDCIVMKDRDSGRSRGYGFVTFSSDNDAQEAIRALNEKSFAGRNVRVNVANPGGGSGGGGGGGGSYAGRGGYASSKSSNYNSGGDRSYSGGSGGGYYGSNTGAAYGNTGAPYSTATAPYSSATAPYINSGYSQDYGRGYAQPYDQQGAVPYQANPADPARTQYSAGQPMEAFAAGQQAGGYPAGQQADSYPAGQQGYSAQPADADSFAANQQAQGSYGNYGTAQPYPGGQRPYYNANQSH